MPQQTTPTVSRTALALNIPVGEAREQQLDALWAMSPTERVAAMWRGDLTLLPTVPVELARAARGARCSAASSHGS